MGDQPDAMGFPCPYVLGATFKIEISPLHGEPIVTEAKVIHVYSPFTMSSVMKVALTAGPGLPSSAILKVYDRRFAASARKDHGVDPPTHESEICYAKYLATSDVAQTEDQLWEQVYAIPESEPEPLEFGEHLAALLTRRYFLSERTVYEALRSLWGTHIPIFYGTTRFLGEASLPGLDATVPGILIEYIPGTNLSRIDPSTVDLDAICINAIHTINRYSDLNVLNRDVRFENFIVKPSGSEIVMIDFGHCRLRKEDEGDEEWREAKRSEDEEGAVGYVAKHQYGWTYVPTRRFSAKVSK